MFITPRHTISAHHQEHGTKVVIIAYDMRCSTRQRYGTMAITKANSQYLPCYIIMYEPIIRQIVYTSNQPKIFALIIAHFAVFVYKICKQTNEIAKKR